MNELCLEEELMHKESSKIGLGYTYIVGYAVMMVSKMQARSFIFYLKS